ncbi:sodium/calcium exchanger NCL2-like isoform X2 [Salvia splendens]|uniref:sodium/calcium exchanger NCL2-like isoform X2 n=1 Tax=Salvia splendens TaxID=180675 RepID=UPI001C256765|nr:sodium/calcium exchanger NCL2-like isoform X2 [Salvia splendens]
MQAAFTSLLMAILVACLVFYIILSVTNTVTGRILRLNTLDDLISDGVDADAIQAPFFNPGRSPNTKCVHSYGFFPCADNIGGYIFEIVVYQYLVIIGGKLIGRGSKRLFNILGTGVYGATVFRILTVLPKIAMVIVSGILKSKEGAQESVSFGVGVYAGSTVFNLTLVWGMCVIIGRKEFLVKSGDAYHHSSFKEKLSELKGTGTTIDKKTCYTAGIMLLSLIPYFIVQAANIFDSSFGTRMVILIALVVSTLMLLSYFLYQIFDPWIQERSLEYSKYENLLVGFLQHVQRHAKEKLVDDSGQPNITVIKGLFSETDKDADKSITFHELEKLIHEIQSGKVEVEKGYAISEMLKTFDLNRDGRIEEDEFVEGCSKWINEAAELAGKGDSDAAELLREAICKKKRFEKAEIEHLMARIMKHAHSEELEAEQLVTYDGKPNMERIKALFKQFDTDRSNSLSRPELEQLIHTTVAKTGDSQLQHEEMVKKFVKDFDMDGDDIVDEQEFVHGMTKWLNKAMDVTKCKDAKRSIDEFDKIMWGEVDDLVYEVGRNEDSHLKLLTWSSTKAIFQVMLGIAILTFLSGPLKTSIQHFSHAIGVPAFFVSFVVVPICLNALSAISAIFPASQKSSRTSSLTFSEIYGGVVMNNIMGLSTLLAIVYIKGLEWDYSAEVLTVLLVCAVIGVLACSQTTYPLWTCLLAFFLYPFSLLMYYVFQYVLGWN